MFRIALVAGATLLALSLAFPIHAQKYGGVLQGVLPGNPPSLSIHDEGTGWVLSAMQPVYNNLVFFDPFKPLETLDTIIPELAESWRWSADGKALTFKLRQGVKWHDGKPFTSADVKETFDIVRGASAKRTKLNPRRAWYATVEEIVTNGDHEVTFRVKSPQLSLLAVLASGYSPVMPAHVAPPEWRAQGMGTGPFVFKEFKRDQYVILEKNRNYWRQDRPYLDGVRMSVIPNQASRMAALKARQIDIDQPTDTIKPVMEALRASDDTLQFVETTGLGFPALHFNPKQPPFDNPQVRLAASLAVDRAAFVKGVAHDGAAVGAVMPPPPGGAWGLPPERLAKLPGYGDPQANLARARELMAGLGYTEQTPLKVTLLTRKFRNYADVAAWVADRIRPIGIAAEVQIVESGVYYGMVTRKEFAMVLHPTGVAVDDPDVLLFENYGCESQRNYSAYCNPEVMRMIEEQSATLDPVRRKALVQEIDARLMNDGARVILGWFKYYNARAPYVRNYIPHQSMFNFSRLQEVWLDK